LNVNIFILIILLKFLRSITIFYQPPNMFDPWFRIVASVMLQNHYIMVKREKMRLRWSNLQLRCCHRDFKISDITVAIAVAAHNLKSYSFDLQLQNNHIACVLHPSLIAI